MGNRLAVFGATGRTGRHVVEQALAAGHEVTAVVRRPEAVAVRHERLVVLKGDALDPGTADAAIAGADAVVSALGVGDRRPTTLYSQSMANIVRAGARRVVCLSSSGVVVDPEMALLPRLVVSQIVGRWFRHPFADMARMEAVLRDAELDSTVIRAPGLTDKPGTGSYEVAVNRHLTRMGSIPRADLACYMLACLDDPTTFGAWVEIVGGP